MNAQLQLPEGTFHHLTSDAQIVGIVTWVGFIATIFGLILAYIQIRKIRRSSDAAAEAIKSMTKIVRGHEQSSKIADAFNFLNSAQTMVGQRNFAAAAAYLFVSWRGLIAARTLTENGAEQEAISTHVVAVRRLYDDLSAPSVASLPSAEFVAARHVELSRIISDVGMLSTSIQTRLSGMGLDR